MVNGKSETRRDTKTGTLKSETKTKKLSDLIEKHICDQQTQNLRLRDPLVGCAIFRDLVEFGETSYFSGDYSPPLIMLIGPDVIIGNFSGKRKRKK